MLGDKTLFFRLILATAGMVGAIGIMAAATASHSEPSRNIAAIAAIGLAHGPALLALGLVGRSKTLLVAAALLALGTLVFMGDLGIREWTGHGLFAGAAPLGGVAMMAGWLTVTLAGLVWRRG